MSEFNYDAVNTTTEFEQNVTPVETPAYTEPAYETPVYGYTTPVQTEGDDVVYEVVYKTDGKKIAAATTIGVLTGMVVSKTVDAVKSAIRRKTKDTPESEEEEKVFKIQSPIVLRRPVVRVSKAKAPAEPVPAPAPATNPENKG